jgi:hypothetical protein
MRCWLPALVLVSVFAGTAGSASAAPAPERYRNQVVYGNDPCPKGGEDEIVVCARQPESERYRVPKRFRNQKRTDAAVQAWGNRVATLDEASRVSAGLPNTCSAVGSGGQTGCHRQFLQQNRAERRAQQEEAATVPGN